MAYFGNSADARTRAGAFAYTRTVVTVIRRKTGDPSLPIHLIGGIANRIGAARTEPGAPPSGCG